MTSSTEQCTPLAEQELRNPQSTLPNPRSEKKPFTQPKLTFIYPRLVKHGDATQNTNAHGFFGAFSPSPGP
jgi:hypothetical protein